jgi:hypothetical protein
VFIWYLGYLRALSFFSAVWMNWRTHFRCRPAENPLMKFDIKLLASIEKKIVMTDWDSKQRSLDK